MNASIELAARLAERLGFPALALGALFYLAILFVRGPLSTVAQGVGDAARAFGSKGGESFTAISAAGVRFFENLERRFDRVEGRLEDHLRDEVEGRAELAAHVTQEHAATRARLESCGRRVECSR